MTKTARTIRILHLYPKEMNIYGDWGNILTLKKRLEWSDYTTEVVEHHPGAAFPLDVDIVVGGGGQDSGQTIVQDDLLTIRDALHTLADKDTPMLVICGLYQLFGRFFKTADGTYIRGIEIFKAETHAGPERLIGNVISKSAYGELVGYENHSGLTFLDTDQPSLATIVKGKGNNGKDTTEGAVYNNVFGSYLHGSLLPKNPQLADTLIRRAVTNKYGGYEPKTLDDSYANHARDVARRRPR